MTGEDSQCLPFHVYVGSEETLGRGIQVLGFAWECFK